ncbi:subtilisin-like protein [Xylaria intraflava]|nr:subtilisin-like protein [Xylaria intraflava]
MTGVVGNLYSQGLLTADRVELVSSKSFNKLNETVSQYWQHFEGDPRVRIVILDTGIDLGHEDFQQARTKTFAGKSGNIACPVQGEPPQISRIKKWTNFWPDQEIDNVNDLDGHGTQVAGIVLRLAPAAELFVARICTGDVNHGVPEKKAPTVEPKSHSKRQCEAIEKAIDWAMDHKVHIIILSAGFRNHEYGDVESLRKKLLAVQYHDNKWKHRAVVFANAATSHEDAYESVAWPAKDPHCAIGIHSCGDSGTQKSNFAGRMFNGDNFMVVGERILAQWPMAKGGGFRACTGSSFATPVAAAVAALVLQFAWQKVCRRKYSSLPGNVPLDGLHTNGGMASVFRRFSTPFDGCLSISMQLFWRTPEFNITLTEDPLLHALKLIQAGLVDT